MTQININQFATESLAGFDVIYIDSEATFSGGQNILQSRASDIANFVAAGGGLITDVGGDFANPDFSWVPNHSSLAWATQNQDTVLLTALGQTHPVTAGLTNAGLSNWGQSQHNIFTATAGMDVLATNPTNQADILAGTFGSGHLVYFGVDPTFHQPVGQSDQLIRQAIRWEAAGIPHGLQPTVTIAGQSATAAAPGQEAVLQTVANPGQLAGGGPPQTYTITVGSANNTTGKYTLRVILNAALENEEHGGPPNNTLDTAQDLTPSFVPLHNAIGGVDADGQPRRAAVLGTTDVAAAPDFYSFSLNAGDSATLAVKGLSGSGVHEELLGPTGTPLALGRTGPSNVDEVIDDFLAPASGTYYARITGSGSPVDYSLVVTVNAGFATQPNTSFATSQNVLSPEVAGGQWVLGAVGSAPSNVVVPGNLARGVVAPAS